MVKYLDEGDIKLRTTGVVLFDLDNLKVINDNFGHEKEDDMIKTFSKTVESCLRDKDIFFRFGGDEFIIIFKNIILNKNRSI